MGALLGVLFWPVIVWGWETEQVYQSESGKTTGLKDEEEVMVDDNDAKFNFALYYFLVIVLSPDIVDCP